MSQPQPSLLELKTRSDEDAVRIWLIDRGLVAVDRKLMDDLAPVSRGIVYDAASDRYLRYTEAA